MIEEQKQEFSKSLAFIKIGAKNFLYLKGIARDLNVASQNIAKLVELSGGEARKKNQTDMHILKPEEVTKKLEVEVGREKARDITPTLERKEKAEVGVGKAVLAGALVKTLGPKKTFKLIDVVLKIKKLFSLSNILKVVTRFALPVVIIASLWEGITNAFDEFKRSGSIWEAVKEGASTIVEFLTGGFIDKDTIKNLMQNVAEFLKPITDIFTNIYDRVVSFVKEKVNSIKEFFGFKIEPKKEMPDVKGEEEVKKKAEEEAKKQKKVAEPPPEVSAPEARKPVAKQAPTPRGVTYEKPPAAAPAPAAEAAPAAPVEKVKPPSSSETKPAKIGSESGKKAMIGAMNDAKISDPTARAAIMAQVGHESGDFTTLSENLNYKASTLMKLFPKKFSGPEDAQQVSSGGPVKVAERIYGGRMGNAPEGGGEGFEYRGRGFIQLTGKQNYTKFGYANNPDELTKPEGAAKSAIKYMLGYKGDWNDVKAVTKFVNGGYIGLDDRIKHFQAYVNDPAITKIDSTQTASSGGGMAVDSAAIASNQRQQAKPSTPVIVDARTTNNTVVKKQETVVAKKSDTPSQSTADMLAARAA